LGGVGGSAYAGAATMVAAATPASIIKFFMVLESSKVAVRAQPRHRTFGFIAGSSSDGVNDVVAPPTH
jgi:hypothetical protein